MYKTVYVQIAFFGKAIITVLLLTPYVYDYCANC